MLGKTISNYSLLQIIGKGGTSTVYLGRNVNTGSLAAVKVLKDQYTEDQDHIKRFFTREIETTKTLNHPNIVKLLNYGKKDSNYYLIYEYIDGITLDKYIKSKKLSIQKIEYFIEDTCRSSLRSFQRCYTQGYKTTKRPYY